MAKRFPAKLPGNSSSMAQIQRMIELYLTGMSTREIGPIVGVDPRTVQRWVRRARVHRPRGMSDQEIMGRKDLGPEILASYDAGSTMKALSVRFGISPPRIKRLLEDSGVKLRPMGVHSRVMAPGDVALAKSLYPRLSFEKLSEMMGYDRQVIANTLRSEGVHILPRGGHVHRKVLYPDSK